MSKIINLYGHLIIDKIFINCNSQESLGGIANVWYGLSKIEPTFNIRILPTAIGEAIVVVDTEGNQRTGRAILNKRTLKNKDFSGDWHHIAYINQIHDTNFISRIKTGLVSADITKENPEKCINSLRFVDFLFISKEDLFDDVKNIAEKTKGWVIAHDPFGSMYSDGTITGEYFIPKEDILTNVNVLGAGDFFASSFISEYIRTNDVEISIKNSHKNTTKLLKS